MNFKNVIENLIYIFAMGAILIVSNYFIIKAQQDAFIEAINKNTTEISNTFDKIKTNKSTLDLNLDNKAQTNINDSIKKSKKFFLFKNKH
jgi:hypothetical protein